MQIFYDISVLGNAHYDQRSRTGVYRVVENIACGLVASTECDTIFCSGIGNENQCQDFLAGHPTLSGTTASFVNNLQSSLNSPYPDKHSIRNLLNRIFLTMRHIEQRKLLYHTPFYPIPDFVRDKRNIATVQTVYDLIPILSPHYFTLGQDQLIKKVIDSITPEDFVIGISESTRNDLCNYSNRVDPEKVHVIYLAASENFYKCTEIELLHDVRMRYGIPEDATYLLSVCTLEPRKNIELVVRSFARLVMEYNVPNLHLVLTGTKGWDYDRIFSAIEYAEMVRSRIILTGFVPDKDLAPLYSGAIAFVYPSLYEGFGLPPLEAMQCGTPVITSNTSSLPEVVGDAGIMVDPHDGDALCQWMLDLYSDEALRNHLSAKSLARAAEFSWKRCVDETIAVYRKAADS
jgi:glycosyltransferase involved in cell wall biosynthesis